MRSERSNHGNRLTSTPDALALQARAAVAQHGNLLGQSLLDRPQQVGGYPQIFGENCWAWRAPVLSCRVVGGQYERVSLISVGRLGSDDCGEVAQLDGNCYNDLGQVVGTVTAWRPGTVNQAPLPQVGIWEPAVGDCCICNPQNQAINVLATGGVNVVFSALTDNAAHAWRIDNNGAPIGTIWQAATTSPATYSVEINVPLPAAITFVPITTGGTAPILQVDALPVATIGVFIGTLQLAALPVGLVAAPANLQGTFIQSAAAANYPGLCVAQTTTSCKGPVSFKVLRGKTVRQVLSAGEYRGAAIAVNPGVVIGDALLNLDTGFSGQVTGVNPVTSSPNVPLSWGDRWLVYRVGDSRYLPDVFLHLLRSVAGLNYLATPEQLIDYPALAVAREFCVTNNYRWHGTTVDQPILKWLTLNAPQSCLMPTRNQGMLGLLPEQSGFASALFTVANCRAFEVHYHPWHEHKINRLVVWHDRDRIATYSLTIEDQALTQGTESIVEEALDWDSIPSQQQREDAARLYYRSIEVQNRSIRFVTVWDSFALKLGDIIEAISPDLEVGADFSGYCNGYSAAGNLIPSFQPILCQGVSGVGSGGVTLTDTSQDFSFYVAPGDAIVVNNVAYTVATVSVDTLTVTTGLAAIGVGAQYTVLDLTIPGSTLATWDSSTGNYQGTYTVTPILNGVNVSYQLGNAGVLPVKGAPIALRVTPKLWRVASVEPLVSSSQAGSSGQATQTLEYVVTGTLYSEALYSFGGLRVIR